MKRPLLFFLIAAGATPGLAAPACPLPFVPGGNGRCYLENRYPMGTAGHAWGTLPRVPELEAGLDPAMIALGRKLFFDQRLAGNGRTACATCHQPSRALTDGRGRSLGKDGLPLRRGAPSLYNVAFLPRLFWDGRARSLEEQALIPLFAPDEMAQTPEGLIQVLSGDDAYARLFRAAFSEDGAGTPARVAMALAAFERTLISLDSAYDRYAAGDAQALTPEQLAGFNVFRSFVTRCAECHAPPLFTTGQMVVTGAPDAAGVKDPGAGAGAFRIPSLRNVALTAPYMHDGAFATLDEVVRFYDEAANAVPYRHWHIRPLGLSPDEKRELAAFLGALTDLSHQPEDL